MSSKSFKKHNTKLIMYRNKNKYHKNKKTFRKRNKHKKRRTKKIFSKNGGDIYSASRARGL
jgi:hypothetical protein